MRPKSINSWKGTYMSGVVHLLHLALMHDHDISGYPAGIDTRDHHRSPVFPLLMLGGSYLRVLIMTRDQIWRLAWGPVGILHGVALSAVILMTVNVMNLYILWAGAFSVGSVYTYLVLDNGGWNTEAALACTPIWCHWSVMQAGTSCRDRVRVGTVVGLRNTHVHSTVA